MAKDLKSPPEVKAATTLADQAIEQMFGYYARQPEAAPNAANDGTRVISELDAAGAILAAKRVA